MDTKIVIFILARKINAAFTWLFWAKPSDSRKYVSIRARKTIFESSLLQKLCSIWADLVVLI